MAAADGGLMLVEERSSDGKVAVRAVEVGLGLRSCPVPQGRCGPVQTDSDRAAAAAGREWNAGWLAGQLRLLQDRAADARLALVLERRQLADQAAAAFSAVFSGAFSLIRVAPLERRYSVTVVMPPRLIGTRF